MNLMKTASHILLLACLICLIPFSVLASPAQATEVDFVAIDAYVAAQMKEIHLPGVALGIIQGDQIVYLKGYGVADPSGRAVTAQTPFWLASLMKPVTALAVMQLVEAGQVDLDAPVQFYIPWFRMSNAQDSATITVRNLLNQNSGISGATGNEQYPAMLDWTLEKRVRELSDNALTHPVGGTYQYSNVNFAILALIVETVTGQPFDTYIQEHVFNPLEMRNATMYRADALPPDSAAGYQQWFGVPVANHVPLPRSGNGGGGLIASAEDMTHFMIAQLNQGRYGSVSLLSPAGITEMHTPVSRDGDTETFYGMGWEVKTVDGQTELSHNGHNANYIGTMLLPGNGWGIVMMTNANSLLAATRATGIPGGVASLLSGGQPSANEGVPIIRMIYWGILVIVALQLIGMVWSIVVLRRWSQNSQPDARPRGWLRVGWLVVLPLVVNLILGFILTVGLPAIMPGGVSLQGFIFNYPDIGYASVLSGLIAFVWIIRTVLAYFALRGEKPVAAELVAA